MKKIDKKRWKSFSKELKEMGLTSSEILRIRKDIEVERSILWERKKII
jgi:hypothetical protein